MSNCMPTNLNNDDILKLIEYIDERTKNYTLSANENYKKLAKLGLSTNDVEKIAQDTKLDESIVKAQKHDMTDVLLHGSSGVPKLTESILQSVKDRTIKKDIDRNLFLVEDRIVNLRELHNNLNRELQNINKEKYLVESSLDDEETLNNELKEYEEEVEELKKNSKIEGNPNYFGILTNIKKLHTSILETSLKVQKTTEVLGKYGDLPPNILMAQSKLNEIEKKYKELSSKLFTNLK